MKKLIVNFLISTIFLTASCFADVSESFLEQNDISEDGTKFYVESGTLLIGSNTIYLKIENNLVPIQAIFCDENGVYINIEDIKRVIKCPKCSRYFNPELYSTICPHTQRI
jgi:hypothetical protein